MIDTGAVRDYLTGLQSRIVAALEAFDGQPFRTDSWQRPEGGGGPTPPHAPASRSLPPEGAHAALGRPGGGPTPPHSRSLPPEGAHAALGRPGGGPTPPHAPASRSLPPEGAHAALGRPGGGPTPPHAPASRSLPPEGAHAALGRPGGGISRLIEEGNFFERGGVNFSHVKGAAMPASATAHRPELAGRRWEAMGVSLVLHPRNPYCPTSHMNVRFFVAEKDDAAPVWWFGGGMDLTPYYGFAEDCAHFHGACRDALAPFGDDVHARYKKWCDEYFFLKHRNEPRGIGGIFFDDLNEGGPGGDTSAPGSFARCFALTRSVGDAFTGAYLPLCERRRNLPYGERERDFQAYRRGRYVEFNLVWDRGTLFGLQSGGRTESILMSMPPVVKWRYDWRPAPGSAEDKLYTDFLPPRDWV